MGLFIPHPALQLNGEKKSRKKTCRVQVIDEFGGCPNSSLHISMGTTRRLFLMLTVTLQYCSFFQSKPLRVPVSIVTVVFLSFIQLFFLAFVELIKNASVHGTKNYYLYYPFLFNISFKVIMQQAAQHNYTMVCCLGVLHR